MTSHCACAHARTCILLCVHRPSALALISCSFLICRRHFACRVRRVLRGSGVIKVFFFSSSPFPVRFVQSCAVLHSVRARRSQTVVSVGGLSWSQVFFAVAGPEQCAKGFTSYDTASRTNSITVFLRPCFIDIE